ncbi:hypothetical protein DTW90_36005 [Neorhizobium sp. P12A]|uniref:hypothetical protein n=1 Tax=Neorhizobium sp. P12A TaxID=2268027 RepID=UPI0011EBB600|nr:hypothetical protein [Neorhizobium sp. P12A]KAA0684546.1 hypothetical protein DTW90_36005 [Neorhizobium sp. P12A]
MYGNNEFRKTKNDSRFGKKNSEGEMSSYALQEAIDWTGKLMDKEFKGRGDKEYQVRYRLSENSGVPESYLYRLQYKSRTMKDVAGEYYRRLKLYYEHTCEVNEDAADRYEAERLRLRGDHEKIDAKRASARVDVAASTIRKGKKG